MPLAPRYGFGLPAEASAQVGRVSRIDEFL